MSNQIANGLLYDTNFAAALNPGSNGIAYSNQLYFSCSNNPAAQYPNPFNTVNAGFGQTLLMNDPLRYIPWAISPRHLATRRKPHRQ